MSDAHALESTRVAPTVPKFDSMEGLDREESEMELSYRTQATTGRTSPLFHATAPPRAPSCSARSDWCPRLLFGVFLILCGMYVTVFVAVRAADGDSRTARALKSATIVLERVEREVVTVRNELDSVSREISVVLSEESSSAGHLRPPGYDSFVRSQRHATRALQALRPRLASIRSALAAGHVRDEDVPQVQQWQESYLGLPPGSLNLTVVPGPPRIRVAPPPAPSRWPFLYFEDLGPAAAAASMLDAGSSVTNAAAINHAVVTGDLAGQRLPRVTEAISGGPMQTLYKAVSHCNMSGLPDHPCAPSPHNASRVLGLLAVIFSPNTMLSSILPSEPLESGIGVQFINPVGEVMGSWKWRDSGHKLVDVTRSMPRLNTMEGEYLLRVAAEDDGTPSALNMAAWGMLIAAISLSGGLFFVLGRHWRSVATHGIAEERRHHAAKRAALRQAALLQLLRATSHDMRTPLHAIGMALGEARSVATEVGGGGAQQELRNALGIAQNATDSLKVIVDNILDAEYIERNDLQLRVEPCRPLDALSPVIAALASSLEGTDVRLVAGTAGPMLPSMCCDADRIARCLFNVLSNSRKWTLRGQILLSVTIANDARAAKQLARRTLIDGGTTRWWLHPFMSEAGDAPGSDGVAGAGAATSGASKSGAAPGEQSSYLCITVRDTGEGMAESEVEACVRPFVGLCRAHGLGDNSSEREGFEEDHATVSGGAGLGLHVVLATVLAHQGCLCISSAAGVGTAVHMCFATPRAPTQAHSGAPGPASHALTATRLGGPPSAAVRSDNPRSAQSRADAGTELSAPQSVLVVDDETVNAKLLQRVVQRAVGGGVVVSVAADGRRAVEAVREGGGSVALVFMDMNMPEMDGLEATRAIRAMEPTIRRRPTVVMVTGNAADHDRRAAIAAGADAFEAKPCSRATILKYLERAGFDLERGGPRPGTLCESPPRSTQGSQWSLVPGEGEYKKQGPVEGVPLLAWGERVAASPGR